MEKLDIKNQLQGLIDKSPETPTQKVQTIKSKEAYHINAYISSDLEYTIKHHCLLHKITIKEFLEIALKEYLERSERVEK